MIKIELQNNVCVKCGAKQATSLENAFLCPSCYTKLYDSEYNGIDALLGEFDKTEKLFGWLKFVWWGIVAFQLGGAAGQINNLFIG